MEGRLKSASQEQRIQPKSMDVLLCLAEHAEGVVGREDLLTSVWGERAQSDEPLTRCIGDLRRALGDARGEPKYIETIHKRGYKLLKPVRPLVSDHQPETTETQPAPESPNSRRRSWSAPLIGATLILALAVIWTIFLTNRDEQNPEAGPLEIVDPASIAVLPFSNRSNREEDQFFTDGMHDELLSRLARISTLKVISRTSMLRYSDTELPIPEIAKQLQVASILEGGVQRSGNQVRINVQLIDAQTDEHLWVEIYDRELTAENLFAIQSEISTAIAEALNATLSPEEHARVTEPSTMSLEANYHFMRGRQLMANRDREELERAVREFEQAVEIDPEFALAWVGLADSIKLLRIAGGIGPEESIPIQTRAVENALALNDQLGEAWVAKGDLLNGEEAGAAYRKAIELAPNYAHAYHSYAFQFQNDVQREQQLTLRYKAVQLDPLSPIYQGNVAATLRLLGREEEALRQYQRLLELDPGHAFAYAGIASIYETAGELAEAVTWREKAVELDPANAFYLYLLGQAYLNLEDFEEVRKVLEWTAERVDPGTWRAWLLDYHVLIRNHDWQGALELLDAVPELYTEMPETHFDRGFVHYWGLGDFHGAREHWSKLRGWRQDLPQNCVFEHVRIMTGEETVGRKRLERALHYHEVTRPGMVQHAYTNNGLGICYLVAGEPQKALEFFDQRIEHGHITDWWFIGTNPLWDPLREDPRFIALGEKVDALIAEQRRLLDEMRAAG